MANERQLKEANYRLLTCSSFALTPATIASTNYVPILGKTRKARRESKTICFGCQGRPIVGKGNATLDVVCGTAYHMAYQIEDEVEPVICRTVNKSVLVTDIAPVLDEEANLMID